MDWEYDFGSSDMRPCGRDGCKQRHGHGWLVALDDGGYVHVGNDCAKKYANADRWDQSVDVYRERRRKEARDTALIEARDKAQQKQHLLLNWPELDRAMRLFDSFERAVGGPFMEELRDRAYKGRPQIEVDVELSDDEYALRKAMQVELGNGRPSAYIARIERKQVGEITGLQCLKPGRAPRDLRNQLQQLISTVLTWRLADGDDEATRGLIEATNRIAPYSNALNESVVAAGSFFSPANLRTLLKLPLARRQGMLSIELTETDEITVERRVNWGKVA